MAPWHPSSQIHRLSAFRSLPPASVCLSVRALDRQLLWIQHWAAPAFPGTASPFDALVPEAPSENPRVSHLEPSTTGLTVSFLLPET